MDSKGNHTIPNYLYICGLLRWNVWCRGWYRQGTANARHGSPSPGFLCIFGLYDPLHQLHCNHIICSIRPARSRLCCPVPPHWFRVDVHWTSRHQLPHQKVSERFPHCIFGRCGCAAISLSHDRTVILGRP